MHARDPHALLHGLTASQQAAVTYGHGPLLIVAGPGAGKTHTMTRRVSWLIASGLAKPSEILALSFTRAAAGEMRSRLVGLLDAQTAKDIRTGTFHSIAVQIIREHHEALGRGPEFSIYDQEDTRRIIRRLQTQPSPQVAEQTARCGAIEPAEVVSEIGLAKSRLWDPDELEWSSQHHQAPLIAALWRDLEHVLQGSNALDFDDLIAGTATLLRDHATIRDAYRRKWRWILVDEFQDTNPAQAQMLAGLVEQNGNLSVVGDDDQAIYSFRLSDPKYMLEFARRYGNTARTVVLEENFRSVPDVVDRATRTVRRNTGRIEKPITVTRTTESQMPAVTSHQFPADDDEARWVTAMIQQCISVGVPPADMMVVARVRKAMRPIERALTAAALPYRLLGGVSMFERKEMRDALAHLILLANGVDEGAFVRAAGCIDGVSDATIGAVLAHSQALHHQASLMDTDADMGASSDLLRCCAQADRIASLTGPQRMGLMQFGRGLMEARDDLYAGRSLATVVSKALGIPGGPVHKQEHIAASSQDPAARDAANKALSDFRSLSDAAAEYAGGLSEDEQPTMGGFLQNIAIDDLTVDEDDEDRRITLASIHKSKGLEARVVFVLGCEEGSLPHFRVLQDGDAQVEEERRLFYVACTRAKDRLALCCANHRGPRKTDGPSRFLTEAFDTPLAAAA